MIERQIPNLYLSPKYYSNYSCVDFVRMQYYIYLELGLRDFL